MRVGKGWGCRGGLLWLESQGEGEVGVRGVGCGDSGE